MPQTTFRFKQFTIEQDKTAMKVGTDGVLLGAWAEFPENGKILDVGTGTGLLALMAAQKTNAIITAIEPDPDSYSQALQNINASVWNKRINVCNSSVQEYAKSANEKFNFIISNPPYHNENVLSPDKKRNLARNNQSLPLNVLIESISSLLNEEGSAAIIYPIAYFNDFCNLLALNDLFPQRITKIRPIPDKEFHRFVLQFGKKQTIIIENELIIENGKRHHYSDEYKRLTQDFYLFYKM